MTVPQLKTDLLSSCQARILDRIRTTAALSSSLSRSTSGISADLNEQLKAIKSAMDPHRSPASADNGMVPNGNSTDSPSGTSKGSKWGVLKKSRR